MIKTIDRREFLAAVNLTTSSIASFTDRPDLAIAPFRFDVTPPIGHSLCGGWIKPVVKIDDSLEAIGYVLTGLGKPIVVCAVDWTGLLNDAHLAWRQALADGAGTTEDRVAVQCVHQHNAPFACLAAQSIVENYRELPPIIDRDFFRTCLELGRKAVRSAISKSRRITHIGHGQAKVERVASNRRVHRNAENKVLSMRGSSCKNAILSALQEGLIDPWLKSVSFFDGETKVVTCHTYAVHPMSYYGDGRVTTDFVGLARKQRQLSEPETTQIAFTGCAGNVAAGKYNDGEPKTRPILQQRIVDAMIASGTSMKREPIGSAMWKADNILPVARITPDITELERQIAETKSPVVKRNRPAFQLAFAKRCKKNKQPIVLSGLSINDISMLNLPAECFVEYQLNAQNDYPDRFVFTAAYGDGGPWYIPTKTEFPCGGYEVEMAYSVADINDQLVKSIRAVLTSTVRS